MPNNMPIITREELITNAPTTNEAILSYFRYGLTPLAARTLEESDHKTLELYNKAMELLSEFDAYYGE